MTYSFESPKVFDRMLIPEDSALRKTVEISNPLGEDFSVMRTTSLNGMLTSLSTNYNRRNKDVRLYELANVYRPKSLPLTELPDERDVYKRQPLPRCCSSACFRSFSQKEGWQCLL